MYNPLITGCIVTYNNMKCIEQTIDSILEHTDPMKFRLYVVDNHSTDGTPDFIRKKYPQVCLVEPGDNRGFGAGHNVVLPMLESKYHFVINPDIILRDDAVDKICAFMDENPDIGVVSPKICFPDGTLQVLGKRNPRLKYLIASRFRDSEKMNKLLEEYAMLDRDLSSPQDIECTSGCFIGFRTEIFKQLGGFDERYFMYFEDADISREAKKLTRVVYYPYATIYHVWERASKTNKKLLLIHIKSMFKYFIKWKTI